MQAEEIAQAIHKQTNPLAMKPLTFSPSESAILAVIDRLLGENARLGGALNRLQHWNHCE